MATPRFIGSEIYRKSDMPILSFNNNELLWCDLLSLAGLSPPLSPKRAVSVPPTFSQAARKLSARIVVSRDTSDQRRQRNYSIYGRPPPRFSLPNRIVGVGCGRWAGGTSARLQTPSAKTTIYIKKFLRNLANNPSCSLYVLEPLGSPLSAISPDPTGGGTRDTPDMPLTPYRWPVLLRDTVRLRYLPEIPLPAAGEAPGPAPVAPEALRIGTAHPNASHGAKATTGRPPRSGNAIMTRQATALLDSLPDDPSE